MATPHFLIEKYDIPAPRYTSYPTVPYWDQSPPTAEAWLDNVARAYQSEPVISLYIHLPYCEQLCTYCGCNKHITKNHAVEVPYIEALLREWAIYRDTFGSRPILRELHLGGGTPTFFSPDNLHRLLSAILADVTTDETAEMSFEAHPSSTSREHLQTLFNLGFRRLSVGVQDVDEDILRIIHRFQTRDQLRFVTQTARDIGYTSVNFDLIYGLPRQNKSHIFATIAEVHELRPDRIAFYSYAHVPWLKNGQRAYDETDLPQAAEKRALYETGRSLLEADGYLDIGMDHFALPTDSLYRSKTDGSLHRNFMGYTSAYTPTLIGLGASSISEAGNMFVQNEKDVSTWLAAAQSGQLRFTRGHVLTGEDLYLRRHILNLMCRNETHWNTPGLPVIADALNRLQDMEAEGLVERNAASCRITPLGQAFLRNICMAFDARYHAAARGERVFSRAV